MFQHHARLIVSATAIGLGTLFLASGPLRSQEKKDNRLAVMISVPEGKWSQAVQNDRRAMHRLLLKKGFHADQILTLSGPVSRNLGLDFIRDAARRIEKWKEGFVFFYYDGSGYYPKDEIGKERPKTGMGFIDGSDEYVLWDELFKILKLPKGVQMTLFPDCCWTNTLGGRLPANVSAMVFQGAANDFQCRYDFHMFGQHPWSIVSYYAIQALEKAETMEEWASTTNGLMKADVERNALPREKAFPITIIGERNNRRIFDFRPAVFLPPGGRK